MPVLVPTPFGLKRSAAIRAADKLLELKRKSLKNEGNGIWDVIAECIKIWQETHPKQWESYLFELGDIKASRADQVYGKSNDTVRYKGDRGNIRYTIDFPEPVYLMVRCVYDDEELPMNKTFFNELGRRFPIFRVAQKI